MPRTTTATPEVDTRPLITRARHAMPGFTTADSAIDALDAYVRSLREMSDDAIAHVGPDVADELLEAAGPVDWSSFELGKRARDLTAERERITAERAALVRLRAELVTRRQDAAIDGADHALAVVRAELETVLQHARPVFAALDGIRTAQAAIDADLITEWRQALDLAGRYTAVRNTQRSLVRELKQHHLDEIDEEIGDRTRLGFETRVLIDVHGYVANAAELVELTAEHRAGRTDDLPWLIDQPLDALAYVLRPEVQPWLPSMGELGAARADHDASLRVLRDESAADAEKRLKAQRAARANATGITFAPPSPLEVAMNRQTRG